MVDAIPSRFGVVSIVSANSGHCIDLSVYLTTVVVVVNAVS